jgi:hypothetical protein
MKSVENEWEQTAMKNAAAPITVKTQQQIDRKNGKPWRSRIVTGSDQGVERSNLMRASLQPKLQTRCSGETVRITRLEA